MKQVVIFNDKVCFPLIVKVELEYTCSQFDTMQRLGHTLMCTYSTCFCRFSITDCMLIMLSNDSDSLKSFPCKSWII